MDKDPLLYHFCQKLVVLSADSRQVLLCRRHGEADYDGVFSFIGGKLEHDDHGTFAGLRREKNEEIGSDCRLRVCTTYSHNIYYIKKDGHHMILPHYLAYFIDGPIKLSAEYSEYAWVAIDGLAAFEPKVETTEAALEQLLRLVPLLKPRDFIEI